MATVATAAAAASTSPSATAPAKDPITCHVLDTSAGRPAQGIHVRLKSQDATFTFESVTDDDGRIFSWKPYNSATDSGDVPAYTLDHVLSVARGPERWTLHFDTEAYFGRDATFFPEAIIVFRVAPGQRYHVPLLLSPYGYTTYRGS